MAVDPINFGHPPGGARIVSITERPRPWWRRVWAWLLGRPCPTEVVVTFGAGPREREGWDNGD